MKSIYMQVTNDKYELPLVVADSAKELSEITGYQLSTIKTNVRKNELGKIKGQFVRVYIEEDE